MVKGMDIEDRYKENVKWQTEEIKTEIKNLVEGKQTAKIRGRHKRDTRKNS